ncbi:hypothetical protein [Lysinibacillus sp. NPDC047702]|uniref:hypothetical protein n=1 Tax=unclassified Lysinibacillus TaxID=2636778 RepID=UPI003D071993
MQDYFDEYKLMHFNYFVVFKTDKLEEDYLPIVPNPQKFNFETMHLWDHDLNIILPALWYI